MARDVPIETVVIPPIQRRSRRLVTPLTDEDRRLLQQSKRLEELRRKVEAQPPMEPTVYRRPIMEAIARAPETFIAADIAEMVQMQINYVFRVLYLLESEGRVQRVGLTVKRDLPGWRKPLVIWSRTKRFRVA